MLKVGIKKAALYLILFSLFVFTACNNFFAGSAAARTTTGEITDTTYLFITPLFDTDKRQDGSRTSSRTAFPEFDSSTCQTFSYSLTSEILSSEVEGAYAPGSGQVIYSIRSDSFTNKSFTFYVKNSEGNIIAIASKNLSLTSPGTALNESLVFSLYTGSAENPAAKGYVNLIIQHDNTNFTFENPKVYSLSDNTEVTAISCSVSGNTCNIQTSSAGINPGLYEIRTYVKNASNVPVLYFMQKIEVWPSLTTDKWYLPDGNLNNTYTLSGDGSNTFYVRGSNGSLYTSGLLPGALAASNSNAGTILSPLASLSAALAKCTQTAEYTIYIDGRITGTSNIDNSFMPSKVTIEGITGNETDILDGNSAGRVLLIRNSGEVIIKNLKITKGNLSGSNDGAGLMINNGCTVKLEGLWLDDNQTNHFGGGISNAGNCFIYGSTVIGSKTPTKKATEEDNSNSAHYGGGIYNKGKLFLGYKGFVSGSDTEPDAEAWTGGIYCNYATDQGGGIHNDGGEITFNSGTISFNDAGLYGGAISSAIRSPKYPKLNISSSASIPAGTDRSNNIYVINGAPITVNAALTSHDSSNPIVIRQATDNIQVLDVATGSGLTIPSVKPAFEIYNTDYIIDNEGVCKLIPGTITVTPGFPGTYSCGYIYTKGESGKRIRLNLKDSSGTIVPVSLINSLKVTLYETGEAIKTWTGTAANNFAEVIEFDYPSYLDDPTEHSFYVEVSLKPEAGGSVAYSYDFWALSLYVTVGVTVPGATFNSTTTLCNDDNIKKSKVFIANRNITIANLWVCDHETTQAEYVAIMGTNPSYFPGSPDAGEIQENRPVEVVSWYDTLVYCNKRSIAEGLTPCYTMKKTTDTAVDSTNPDDWGEVPTTSNSRWNAVTCNFNANGYRLPTEAEWEYCARGGNLTGEQFTYSGTSNQSDLKNYAWYSGTTGVNSKTHEVGKKSPNAKGLYDMSGNVEEWCWDRYGAITAETLADGASSGSGRTFRGGAFDSNNSNCTVSVRGSRDPYSRVINLGFRVVRTAD